MASLGLIISVLGFDETGTALMLTIFALQDSFGTACNVTGDGALTLILTGYAEKHGITEHSDEMQKAKAANIARARIKTRQPKLKLSLLAIWIFFGAIRFLIDIICIFLPNFIPFFFC
jgi:hypothetical protein